MIREAGNVSTVEWNEKSSAPCALSRETRWSVPLHHIKPWNIIFLVKKVHFCSERNASCVSGCVLSATPCIILSYTASFFQTLRLARKWKEESAGMCCSSGKTHLPPLQPPPEPLRTYLKGETRDAKQFLANVCKYNAAFQMTSFGGKVCKESGYMPTFKVQGQIYHLMGSMLPVGNGVPQSVYILCVFRLGYSGNSRQPSMKLLIDVDLCRLDDCTRSRSVRAHPSVERITASRLIKL